MTNSNADCLCGSRTHMNTSATGTMMMPSITSTVGSSGDDQSNVQHELNCLLTLQKLANLHIFAVACS